jgi:hypothetical protein
MKTKFQIFVSSTYEDLKTERDIVIKAVLEMGNIPVGMEMFSAGDEQQWELIKRQIDDCDYYVLILAHRYGSMDGAISYTEKEYDYALQSGIPTLTFILDEDARWAKSKMDSDAVKQQALASFKEKAKKKIVDFWKGSDDLHAKVAIALSKAATAYPRPGWVRATATAGPDVMNELSRLSKENAELRAASAAFDFQRKTDIEEEHRRIMQLLKNNKVTPSFFFEDASAWEPRPEKIALWAIFSRLAPELMVEKSVKDSAKFLGLMLRPATLQPDKNLRDEWPPSNHVKSWLADFHALNLIEPSPRKHQVKDTNEYWCITDLGKTIYLQMRIAVLEGKIEKPLNTENTEPI